MVTPRDVVFWLRADIIRTAELLLGCLSILPKIASPYGVKRDSDALNAWNDLPRGGLPFIKLFGAAS